MINKLKKNLENNKNLLLNFLSLSVFQAGNYLLPLITFPYLVRVLGIEYFGLLAFATATISYFNIITDYGFNLTATREVSYHREDKEKLVEIFSSVITIKFIIMFFSFIFLSILIFSFEKFNKDGHIYILTFGAVLGKVFFPRWFFQGMERMKYITFSTILANSVSAIGIFTLVQKQNDFYIVPILSSLGHIVAGIWALIIVKIKFGISFRFQKTDTLKYFLKEGWHIFISGLFTLFYTTSTTFILGLFTNSTVVGYYSLAENVVKIVGGAFSPLNDAVFPYVNNLIKKSNESAKQFIKKYTIYSFIVMSIFSALLYTFAYDITLIIAKEGYKESVIVLKILAILPLIITMARIFSVNYIINFHFEKELSKIYLSSACLSLLLFFILVPLYQSIGSAITVILTELFATLYMYIIIRRKIL